MKFAKLYFKLLDVLQSANQNHGIIRIQKREKVIVSYKRKTANNKFHFE